MSQDTNKNTMNKNLAENKRRWFNSHEEVKTRTDLQDLLNSLWVKENLKKMLSKIEEMTNLATSIQQEI